MAMAMAAAGPRFHVLAVDDSLTDRKIIERLLKISSYQVTTVDSGSKALEFLGLHANHQHSHPSVPCYQQDIEVNLIITDYCMPGMTGYDLLKKVKESSSLSGIPVVIMSSENAPSRINRCLEEGAEEFFLKPVQLSDMEKLRPHILKGRSRGLFHHQEEEGKVHHRRLLSPSPQEEEEHDELLLLLQNDQSTISSGGISSSNIKRKAHDEGFTPERTRTRYITNDSCTLATV